MSLTADHWAETRATLTSLLSRDNPTLRDDTSVRSAALVHQTRVTMHLPAEIGDYTDFYSSKEFASQRSLVPSPQPEAHRLRG